MPACRHYNAPSANGPSPSLSVRLPLKEERAVLPRIVRAAAPARVRLGIALAKEAEKAAVVVARKEGVGRRARARDEAALRVVVQRNDELRAIVGLAVQRLIRDDDRGSR